MKKLVRICAILLALSMCSLSACNRAADSGASESTGGIMANDESSAPITEEGGESTLPDGILSADELYDKVAGSWVGQMVGVTWGAPTEFIYCSRIIPENELPTWTPEMVNDAFGQDDLYVEIPFLNAMKDHGVNCSLDILGQYFADSKFSLAHANLIGRENLRAGISAAEAGHYRNNWHADDIDWQIEADFLGMIYPGLPSEAASRAFEIGHLMNWGDGVYGGVFVSAMHAAAFSATSVREIIDAGVAAVPEGSKFRAVADEVLAAYDAGMSWEDCWQQIETNWCDDDKCAEGKGAFNIDAKLNAAYVLIGRLWGEGDMEDTIVISMRCGQDSDCNPSTAAAILGNFYGLSGIEERFKSAVDYDGKVFAYTDYTLNDCIEINCALAAEYLEGMGYAVEGGWMLPNVTEITPVPLEQWPDDEITAYLSLTPKADGVVAIKLLYVSPDENVTIRMDMGDGVTLDGAVAAYTYLKAGEYTVTVTVTDGAGHSCTVGKTVTATGERGFNMTASCSVTSPLGGGSRDIGVICDGVIPTDDITQQYDTYGGDGDDITYALYFDRKVTVSHIYFTEGAHFDNGGWFRETPTAQLLVDGQWIDASYTFSPLYIEVDSMSAQGDPYETFTFTLDTPVKCDGIRVCGEGGGSSSFASCAELDVGFTEIENPVYSEGVGIEKESIIIVSETAPIGAGCKGIEIMRDGILPQSGDHHGSVQYDTFTNRTDEHDDYFGYLFRRSYTVSALSFTEGAHFDNGGWFKDGSIRVEALIDGNWVTVECEVTPDYPNGNTQDKFKKNYETYTFTLKVPTVCDGIRIAGSAGGSANFTSVSELSVEGVPTE